MTSLLELLRSGEFVVNEGPPIEMTYKDLLIRELQPSDEEALRCWGARLPVTLPESLLEAYGVPISYGVRPGLYRHAYPCAGSVNGRFVGAAALCVKEILVNGALIPMMYGIDGIIHPDFRSLGYVSIILLRGSLIAISEGIACHALYGSVSASNTPSLRTCEKSGMKVILHYQRLFWPLSDDSSELPLSPVQRDTDIRSCGKRMREQFGHYDFLPVDPEEITEQEPFLGTFTLVRGGHQASVSLWNTNYTADLVFLDTKEQVRGFFMFAGTGEASLLIELITYIAIWCKREGGKGYLVVNVMSSPEFDPLTTAFPQAAAQNQISLRSLPYVYTLNDHTPTKEIIRATLGQSESIRQDHISRGDNLSDLEQEPGYFYPRPLFFDPRDNGILLVPRESLRSNL